jgi:hypothetical protein
MACNRDIFTLLYFYCGYLLTYRAEPFLRIWQSCNYSRTSQHFKEPEGSIPRSQEPSTGPYPEPVRSSPYRPILSKIHFNIVHSPTFWSSQWCLSFWLSHQYPIGLCIPLCPHSCYIPCPSHTPWLDHSNYVWQGLQVMKLLIMQFPQISRHFITPVVITWYSLFLFWSCSGKTEPFPHLWPWIHGL